MAFRFTGRFCLTTRTTPGERSVICAAAAGAYGYLCHATVEGQLLQQVLREMKGNHLRMRCLAPRGEPPSGGLSIYGFDCGRYPIGPTVIVE
jgi:hypothetical protein